MTACRPTNRKPDRIRAEECRAWSHPLRSSKNEPRESERTTGLKTLIYVDLKGFPEIREIENREARTRPSAKANRHESVPADKPRTRPNPGCGVPGHRAPRLRPSKNEPSASEPTTPFNTPIYIDLEGFPGIREIENQEARNQAECKSEPTRKCADKQTANPAESGLRNAIAGSPKHVRFGCRPEVSILEFTT